LSDIFAIRTGLKQDVLSSLLYNFALKYAIKRVHINQDSLKLNGTQQLLVYADYDDLLGASVRKIEKNTASLVGASKETALEVKADKTKYMVMYRDQNARRSHSMKIDNSSFERVEGFKYLAPTFTNKNSIQEEIKSRLKSENVSYHSVQNLLSSSLLS
jgi:hypothetical protein